MTAQAVKTVVKQLVDAGLNFSLTPAGGLAVAPVRYLTADLRNLIRSSKAMLIDWLTTANEAATRATYTPVNPQGWKELATAYHAHHFNCPTCIAAGRGSHYGQRCGAGMALWRVYCDSSESHL
jgi:hypothetical protein